MQTELKKLQAAKREHTKLLRNQTHYETQLRTLRGDLASLKQLKVCIVDDSRFVFLCLHVMSKMYGVSQQKYPPPCGFLTFFPKRL